MPCAFRSTGPLRVAFSRHLSAPPPPPRRPRPYLHTGQKRRQRAVQPASIHQGHGHHQCPRPTAGASSPALAVLGTVLLAVAFTRRRPLTARAGASWPSSACSPSLARSTSTTRHPAGWLVLWPAYSARHSTAAASVGIGPARRFLPLPDQAYHVRPRSIDARVAGRSLTPLQATSISMDSSWS